VATRDSEGSSLARLLMPFFSKQDVRCPVGRINFNGSVRGVSVCLFSRKLLIRLTLFHKNSFEIACAKPHIDSDTSLTIASDGLIQKAQNTNAGSAPGGDTAGR
jgi:hypothetical protein